MVKSQLMFQINNILAPKLKFLIVNKYSQIKYYKTTLGSSKKYFFIGHHKCATQYIKSVLKDICLTKKFPIQLRGGDWRRTPGRNDIRFNKFICIQNYEHGIVDFDKYDYKAFHIIRDPRDILISQYFSHRDTHPLTHPLIEEDHEKLTSCQEDEGIKYLITESRYFRKLMNEMIDWNYDNRNVYETKFEKLIENPIDEFNNIFIFLGIQIERDILSKIIDNNSFSKLKVKYSKGVSNSKSSHYRKGRPGDWKNSLNEVNKKLFKEKYGDVLIGLNYEKNLNW